jgi:hypothetical protein
MIQKNDIIEKAYECGFGDIGFTTMIEPFELLKKLLMERQDAYAWVNRLGMDMIAQAFFGL